jgi:hypothetical protein
MMVMVAPPSRFHTHNRYDQSLPGSDKNAEVKNPVLLGMTYNKIQHFLIANC